MKTILALLAGVITTLMTMAFVFLLESATGFNLFMVHMLFIIPAGAILVGAASASGVMLASWRLNLRPNILLFYIVLFLGVSANLLFYGLAYFRDLAAVGLTSGDVSLFQYMSAYAADLQLRWIDNGPLLMFVQFAGFAAGASWIFFRFASEDVCKKCDGYLRKIESQNVYFAEQEHLEFYIGLLADSPLKASTLKVCMNAGGVKYRAGKHNYEWLRTLMECRECKSFYWRDRALEREEADWIDMEWAKRLVSLSGTFEHEGFFASLVDAKIREAASIKYYEENAQSKDSIETAP